MKPGFKASFTDQGLAFRVQLKELKEGEMGFALSKDK